MKICHNFTVDDLFHLYRGGRVSKATAIVGSLAGIKPVLHVDNEGHLIPIGKVRGRKKSLHALVERMETRHGLRQLSYMKELGMGNDRYRLIDIDNGDREISLADAVKDVVPFQELVKTDRDKKDRYGAGVQIFSCLFLADTSDFTNYELQLLDNILIQLHEPLI